MVDCRCCASNQLEIVLDLGRQPWGNHFVPIAQPIELPRYPLELFFCKNCSMVQIGYTVPKEVMFSDHHYLSGTTRSLRQHFSTVCDKILKRMHIAPDDYIIDIGGNDGTFLAFFRDENINVLNVESGVKQARISQENDIPCLNKFFNEATAEPALLLLRVRVWLFPDKVSVVLDSIRS